MLRAVYVTFVCMCISICVCMHMSAYVCHLGCRLGRFWGRVGRLWGRILPLSPQAAVLTTNSIRDREDREVGRTMVAYRNDRHVEG